MGKVTQSVNNDVYKIVNEIASQALGKSAIKAVNTASFVNLGDAVLNSNDSTETFMSALMLRLARTYYTFRPYQSSLHDLMVTGEEWGAVYRKVDANVPEFVQDETFEIEDGKSVDQYIVRKPTASQKLFIRRATYSNFVTISKKLLKEAFVSEADFAAFVRMIFGKMRIKLEFATENMARLAIGNYAAIASTHPAQCVDLVTRYNTERGLTGADAVPTGESALFNNDFMAYATGIIELYAKRFRTLSTAFNIEGAERHTPASEQRLLVYDGFQSMLQHVVQYQAFHDDYVKLKSFIEVPYWQGEQDRTTITLEVQSQTAGAEPAAETVTVTNLVGVLFDKYALGTFRSDEETLTTPVNARARYYNTFYFAEQLWYNDLSENFVMFTLN